MQTIIDRQFRRTCSECGWALVCYLVILNYLAQVSSMVGAIQLSLERFFGAIPSQERIFSLIYDNVYGYHAAILTGVVLLLCWKGIPFWKEQIWKRGQPMTLGSFFALLAVFLAVQTAVSWLVEGIDYLLNYANVDIMGAYEELMANEADSLSMFLYAVLLGPISEELLFRGLILRSLSPYGRRFAIIMSAFLFGMLHGNLVQIPYAFALGLVFGYAAMEYSIGWSMVLHMMNNLVLGDMAERLSKVIMSDYFWYGYSILLWGFSLAGIVILIRSRKKWLIFRRNDPITGWHYKGMFCNFGMIIFLALTCAEAVYFSFFF